MISDSDARIITINVMILNLLNRGYKFPEQCSNIDDDENCPSTLYEGIEFKHIWKDKRGLIYVKDVVFRAYPSNKYAYIFKNNQEKTSELIMGDDGLYVYSSEEYLVSGIMNQNMLGTVANKKTTQLPLEDLLSLSDTEFEKKYSE